MNKEDVGLFVSTSDSLNQQEPLVDLTSFAYFTCNTMIYMLLFTYASYDLSHQFSTGDGPLSGSSAPALAQGVAGWREAARDAGSRDWARGGMELPGDKDEDVKMILTRAERCEEPKGPPKHRTEKVVRGMHS